MFKTLQLILFCFSTLAFTAHANVLYVTDVQLNKTMSQRFPIDLKYPNYNLLLSNPQIILRPEQEVLDKKVKVRVQVDASNNQNWLKASFVLKGSIKYAANERMLRMENVYIDFDTFKVTEGSENHEQLYKKVKQSSGKLLNKINLVEFEKLDMQYRLQKPLDISVMPKKLIIRLEE